MSKFKQLLVLNLVEITAKDIFEAQKAIKIHEKVGVRLLDLPKFLLNEVYKKITETEYFLQFVAEEMGYENRKWICFDVEYADPYLQDIINESGLESLFDEDELDLLIAAPKITYQQYVHYFNNKIYLLTDVEYLEDEIFVDVIKRLDLDSL